MEKTSAQGTLRIGEIAKRTGVTPEVLRAWETRYGLLQPTRTTGGFRLYSDEDERRVRMTKALIASGLSASEAAGRALLTSAAPSSNGNGTSGSAADAAVGDGSVIADLSSRLEDALDNFDAATAHSVFDQLLISVSTEVLMTEVLLPYLKKVGDRWMSGDISIPQEHFSSNLIRGRLMGLARDWGSGQGPAVVLACPQGEEHDIGLIMFGIEASRRGWRVVFLGADTPLDTLRQAVDVTHPAAVVLAVLGSDLIKDIAATVAQLSSSTKVFLCGAGATGSNGSVPGANILAGDPVAAARSFTV